MNTALNQDEAVLAVLVLTVTLQVLSDADGLLDQVVEVFGDFWGQAVKAKDADNLVAGDGANLANTIAIAKDDADLGGSEALFGEAADQVGDFFGSAFEPGGWATGVGDGGSGDTFAGGVHASHGDGWI